MSTVTQSWQDRACLALHISAGTEWRTIFHICLARKMYMNDEASLDNIFRHMLRIFLLVGPDGRELSNANLALIAKERKILFEDTPHANLDLLSMLTGLGISKHALLHDAEAKKASKELSDEARFWVKHLFEEVGEE